MENKNQLILILIGLLVLGGLGVYFVTSSEDTTTDTTDNSVVVDDAMPSDANDASDTSMMVDEESELMMEAPETAVKYRFTDATASYVVNKGWLNRPTEEVVGSTNDVAGEGWFDPETGALSVSASVDLLSLDSGSSGRDNDVDSYFDTPEAILMLETEESEIVLGEEFEINVPVMLGVGGVEREVTMNMTGTVTESGFTATGTADSLVSDWGIEPPSAAGIYNVADELELRFEVTGEAL